ncbi:MAG: FtsX-like permease family protein [Planctomycetota bacterium]|nr:FtsX-like permease family protein [Planctomycetota bacterium]
MGADRRLAPEGGGGADVLLQIGDMSRPLPRRTMIGLVVGGLKVRMARSVVTMASVTLATAFLFYTGFTNGLYFRMAEANDPEINLLLRRAGVSPQATLLGNPMDKWLIGMALLTCAVGIANAMLMSVTERFREIGTMKCLGAEDGLVVKLFLLESAFLGVIGTVFGVALGCLVALGSAWHQFGRYAVEYFPLIESAETAGWSLAAGVMLSVVGAGYPALVAARMRPVEALRVEE